MNIVVIGGPGSGKGTLSSHLQREEGFSVFDAGDALRAFAASNSGDLARRLAAGEHAPTELVFDLLQQNLAGAPRTDWVLSGLPRNMEQAEILARHIERGTIRIDRILCLEAPDDVLIQRLVTRRSCEGCGEIYNVETKPPPRPETCGCGRTLTERDDDHALAIRRRLDLFHARTTPAIDRIRATGVPVVRIDATRPIHEFCERGQQLVREIRIPARAGRRGLVA